MSKYMSGFCGTGAHEGTKPKSLSGKARKTCTAVSICECKCHVDISLMYEMTGKERVVKPNPDYEPYVIDFWMPMVGGDENPVAATLLSPGTITLPRMEGAAPAIPAPVRGIAEGSRAYGATPTGRRAKGLLEDEVRHVCNLYMKGEVEGPMTPQQVSNLIDEADPPSVGAISAVFKRWVDVGFAETDTKPARFVCYTVAGMKLGLEKLKADAKRKAKMKQGAQRRGERT